MKKWIEEKITCFTYLNAAQFLGVLNDNIYKFLIAFFLIGLEGPEHSATILAVTGAIYVIPFLLFSSPSGTLADRYSKSRIIVLTKLLEVITMTLGLLGFLFHWRFGSYLVLFLMSTQSAIFSPSKYGIIPEIIHEDKISKANGLINFFTYLAIIFGTFFAAFIVQVTGRNFVIAALFCIVVAVLGFLASLKMQPTKPAGSQKKVTPNIVKDIYQTYKKIWTEAQAPSVLLVCIATAAYFLFVGAFVQMALIPFSVQVLGLSDVEGGYLFLCTALGIGLGSFLAGRLSGKTIELGLVPLMTFLLSFGMILLYVFSFNWVYIVPLAFLLGLSGGMLLVPVESYIQVFSPLLLRGQIIAAGNFLSFLGVLVASFSLFFLSDVLALPMDQCFLVMGCVSMLFFIVTYMQFYDFATRLICTGLAKLHFRTTVVGEEALPNQPVIFVVPHTAWNDTLLMLGSQRRRLRFFIQEKKEHTSFFMWLYKLLRVIELNPVYPLREDSTCLRLIYEQLRRGVSVCIFVEDDATDEIVKELKHSKLLQELLKELPTPLVPVHIRKGEKQRPRASSYCSLDKFACPATVTFGAHEIKMS